MKPSVSCFLSKEPTPRLFIYTFKANLTHTSLVWSPPWWCPSQLWKDLCPVQSPKKEQQHQTWICSFSRSICNVLLHGRLRPAFWLCGTRRPHPVRPSGLLSEAAGPAGIQTDQQLPEQQRTKRCKGVGGKKPAVWFFFLNLIFKQKVSAVFCLTGSAEAAWGCLEIRGSRRSRTSYVLNLDTDFCLMKSLMRFVALMRGLSADSLKDRWASGFRRS